MKTKLKRTSKTQTEAIDASPEAREREAMFRRIIKNFEEVRKSVRKPPGLTTRMLIEEGRRY